MKIIVTLALIASPMAALAQENGDNHWPLYGNLGPHHMVITTSSDTAQRYFNEGLQFMYAFGVASARRSFREAQKHDPNCAMCFWGEAWGWAPHLTGGMGPEQERRAYEALEKARGLLRHATDRERALIETFATRFSANPSSDTRRSLDSAYSRAMRDLAAQYPQDNDIVGLYAESLMLLRPRRGSVDLDAPDVQRIIGVLESVLARDIRHPGACHWYIHLVEATDEPERAEACADHLGDAIPGASHIRHMPSHIYMNVGRYGDGVRANQKAWHVDQQAAYGGPPGIYPSHNLHMLLYGAVLDGQSAVAIQAARDVGKVSAQHGFYLPVTLAAFGRWDDILELTSPPEIEFHEGMWRFARGLARLRTDDTPGARKELRRLQAIIDEAPEDARFRFHPQTDLLGIPASILEGELLAADEAWDEAVRVLERGVALEDGLTYDEPEPWHVPVRHYLGAVLLESGDAAAAERVYREAIDVLENDPWALFGLEQALRAQGKQAEADRVQQEFERHFARADVWLRSSRF